MGVRYLSPRIPTLAHGRAVLGSTAWTTRSCHSANARPQRDCDSVDTAKIQSTRRTLQVSEIFKSVQGEGPFCGVPSIFLRLGICNLSCVWCDTSYTWLFNEKRLNKVRQNIAQHSSPAVRASKTYNLQVYDKSSELRRYSIAEISDQISSLAQHSVRNIVITGGEPLLHKKHIIPLIHPFVDRGFSIEFETNGTISPDLLGSYAQHIHFNVSPKLSNSLQPYEQRINLDVLRQCLEFPSSVLKFVVDNLDDVKELVDIVEATGAPPSRVHLMPQGSVS